MIRVGILGEIGFDFNGRPEAIWGNRNYQVRQIPLAQNRFSKFLAAEMDASRVWIDLSASQPTTPNDFWNSVKKNLPLGSLPFDFFVVGDVETAWFALNYFRADKNVVKNLVYVAHSLLKVGGVLNFPGPQNPNDEVNRLLTYESEVLNSCKAIVCPSLNRMDEIKKNYLNSNFPDLDKKIFCIPHGTNPIGKESNTGRDISIKEGLEGVFFPPPPYQNQPLTNPAANLPPPPDELVVFMASSVDSQSDYLTAIEGLGQWKTVTNKKVCLRISCLDENDNHFQRIIQAGRGKGIRMEIINGFQNGMQMQSHYRTAHITLLTSVTEAFGNVVSESLYEGTPVVATDTGAIPNWVDATHGELLKTPITSQKVVDAIQKVVGEHSKNWMRMGGYSIINKRDDFLPPPDSLVKMTWKACAEKYLGLFRYLLSQP